ncbi:MAG: AsmA family protein [Alphaproteobacteria bacterium]|nr:AsmA family protein [Alphaproteobacteria bacterium]
MKKVLIGLVAILAVAVGAALIAPSFIDWNAYRGEIAAEVGKATGRAFAIDGAIAVSLLPAPELSVRKARLANLTGAHDAEMVRLDALDLRIAFWPLLSGKVVVQSVVLRGADIRLEKLADGRENWSFDKPGAEPAAVVPGVGGGAPVGPARGAGDAISLEQVRIENSRLTYRDSGTGSVQHAADINARIAAGTLSGPFAARGLLRYGGLPLSFELRADRIIEGASTKLNLETGFPEAKAKIVYAGYVTPGKPSVTLTGTLTAEGPNLGALLTTLARAAEPAAEAAKPKAASRSAPKSSSKSRSKSPSKAGAETMPGLARPFSLSANLTGGADQIALKDIAGQFDGTKASGQVTIAPGDVTQIDGSVKVNRLDLDKWLAGAGEAGAGKTAKTAKPKGKARAKQAGFELPKTFSVSLQAEVGNVVYRKGLARDLRATVALDKGALQVRSLSARLPGGSQVTLAGRVTERKSGPRFGGKLSLDSNDFQALARWLGADLKSLPRDRLRKVRLRATVGTAPQRIELTNLDFRFDSSRLTGGMVLALRDRVGIGTRLILDRINLDAYLPKAAPPGKGAKAGGRSPVAPVPATGGLAALAAFDANFNLSVGRLTYGGERISGLAAEGTLAGGTLTLKKLAAASLAGAKLEAAGTVRAIDKTPVPDITLDLSAANPRRLFALAALPMPLAAEQLSPFAVKGRLKSDAEGIAADLRLGAGRIDIAAKGRIAGLDGVPRADLDLSLGHPDFVTFVRLFDAGFTPERTVSAPLAVSARVSSAGLDVKLEQLKAQLGQTRLAGRASLSLAALPPVLKGDLSGDEIILDHFLPGPEASGSPRPGATGKAGPGKAGPSGAPWSDDAIDVGMLSALDADLQIRAKAIAWRRWRVVEPRLDVTLDKGRLAMRRLAGGMLGGSFHMTGGLAAPAKAGGPLEAKFDIDVARMDLKQAMFNAADIDVVKGMVDFKMALTGTGRSSRAIARSLAGQGSLRASDGAVSGFNLTAVNDRIKNLRDGLSLLSLLQSAMAGGSTRFSRLSGNFDVKDGVLRSKDVALDADGGSGRGTLLVDIGRWLMDGAMEFRLAGNTEAPPFSLRMKGPLDNPRRIIQANALQAWLAQRAAGALINQFMGKPKQPQGGTGGAPQTAPSQPPPDPRDQFIRGIFDALKKK